MRGRARLAALAVLSLSLAACAPAPDSGRQGAGHPVSPGHLAPADSHTDESPESGEDDAEEGSGDTSPENPGGLNILGQGGTDPIARDTEAPGLTWADGAPVRVSVVSMAQARQQGAGSATLLDLTDLPVAPAADTNVMITVVGSQGENWLGFALEQSMIMSEDGEGAPAKVFLVSGTGRTWTKGPQISGMEWADPRKFAYDAGRLYFAVEPQISEDPDKPSPWKLQSWKPGEKTPRDVVNEADAKGTTAGASLTVVGGTLYFVASVSIYESAEDLYSVPLKGGKPRLVAERVSRPIASGKDLFFETYGESELLVDEYGFGPTAAITAIWRLTGSAKPVRVLNLDADDTEELLQRSLEGRSEGPVSDDYGRPLVSPALLAASGSTLVIRHREQVLTLNTARHTGTRIIPIPATINPSEPNWRSPLAAVCPGGVAVAVPVNNFGSTVLLWQSQPDRAPTWLRASDFVSAVGCNSDGPVLTLANQDSGGTGTLESVVPGEE